MANWEVVAVAHSWGDIRWTNSDGEPIGQPEWTILPGEVEKFTPLYWEGPEMTRIADALERIADVMEETAMRSKHWSEWGNNG